MNAVMRNLKKYRRKLKKCYSLFFFSRRMGSVLQSILSGILQTCAGFFNLRNLEIIILEDFSGEFGVILPQKV